MATKLFTVFFLVILLIAHPRASIAESEPLLRFDPFRKPEISQQRRSPLKGEPSVRTDLWVPELRATMIAKKNSMVNVDGLILAIGEKIQGYELVAVEERSAIFKKAGHRIKLIMNEGEAVE